MARKRILFTIGLVLAVAAGSIWWFLLRGPSPERVEAVLDAFESVPRMRYFDPSRPQDRPTLGEADAAVLTAWLRRAYELTQFRIGVALGTNEFEEAYDALLEDPFNLMDA